MQAVQASIGQFGTGSSQQQIWLDDVNCTSSHQLLSECGNRGWGRHNCHHWEDVGVICEGVMVWKCEGGESEVVRCTCL